MDLIDLRAIEIIRQRIRTNSAGNPTVSLFGQVSTVTMELSGNLMQFVYVCKVVAVECCRGVVCCDNLA